MARNLQTRVCRQDDRRNTLVGTVAFAGGSGGIPLKPKGTGGSPNS
jgi:hypothetical protein